MILVREARGVLKLLFDSLGGKLKDGAPAGTGQASTVSGMLEELHEDIARELR